MTTFGQFGGLQIKTTEFQIENNHQLDNSLIPNTSETHMIFH